MVAQLSNRGTNDFEMKTRIATLEIVEPVIRCEVAEIEGDVRPAYKWFVLAQVPYFVWVSIASVLQLSITAMNWRRKRGKHDP